MSYEANLDSRDLEKRFKILELKSNLEECEKEELKELKSLKEECVNMGWEYGILFIHESNTYEYFKELAEDCYLSINKDNPIYNYIDWDKWSNACLLDYYEIEYNGEIYYYREA